MTSHAELKTVDDVRALLAEADPSQQLVPCGIGRVILGSHAIDTVADSVAELLGEAGTSQRPEVVLLVDEKPILRTGEDVKTTVEAQLRERFTVRKEVLSDGHSELHVSEEVVEAAARACAGAQAVVAVGGGTISDIGKLASDRAGAGALVAVQTAASVDGYTDDVSVLLRDGVKRTVPSRWPDVVIADIETIGGAPAAMNRAGYGEMTSMFTAPADWRLASLVGVDNTFHTGPIRLLEAVGTDLATWSPGLGRGEPQAVERLTWALAVRGIATGVAGTTACLSGVEHLVSHMLDLHHGERGLRMGLHGAQVGVASVLAAAAWDMLFDRMASQQRAPRIDESAMDPGLAEERVKSAFDDLDPTGRIAAECWNDYSRKLEACRQRRDALEGVLSGWAQHASELRSLVRPSVEIGAGLRAAGASASFGELDPAVPADLATWAVSSCALMRNRFTVVDLLMFLGWWSPLDVTEVFERANRAVAGEAQDRGGPGVG